MGYNKNFATLAVRLPPLAGPRPARGFAPGASEKEDPVEKVIVCRSVHQGNTEKVARAMAAELAATVAGPGETGAAPADAGRIIGFGSGIYAGRHHRGVVSLVKALPEGKGRKVFVFSTSGRGTEKYNEPLARLLSDRGYEVVGSFACRGFDRFGPLKLFGGINRGRPDADDLAAAGRFARGLAARLAGSGEAERK